MPDTPVRVAFLTHYTELYGANLSLLNLMDGLSGYGVVPHVIAPEGGDLIAELARRRIPAAVLPFDWWVSTRRTLAGATTRLVRSVRAVPALVKQMTAWGTQLVYSNSSVFAVGAVAAGWLKVPHVWHLREFGDRDYDLLPDLGPRLRGRILRSADAMIFVSHALRKAFFPGGPPPTNSHVIYNGVARAAEFDARRAAADGVRGRVQPFTFALVGRFRDGKGQAVAIEAFAQVAGRFPNSRLLLVGGAGATGDQAYSDHCRALAAASGLAGRMEFWGYIPDPERAFLAADVALMCSRNEAMGRVTVEAMAAGRPVIGFDGGGTTELISHERTGLLYRGGASELAAGMARYLSEPTAAVRHGDAAWHAAKLKHTTEVYAASVWDVLRGVAGRRW